MKIQLNVSGKKVSDALKINNWAILLIFCCYSCTKSRFLDENPNQRLAVPKTLSDFRLLLDNAPIMNGFGIGLVPGLGEVGSDDYYVNEYLYNSGLISNPIYGEMYTWKDNIFIDPDRKPEDWGFPYRCISYANLILEGVDGISPKQSEVAEFNEIKGAALFFRSYMFYELLQIFAPQYDKLTANKDLGIPLRFDADINKKVVRSSVEECYSQIIVDLEKAASLLPDKVSYNTRPSKAAVFGLLARIFLTTGDYDSAQKNADFCLNISNVLIDYNTLSKDNLFPFDRLNKEIIFYSALGINFMELISIYYSRINQELVDSYSVDDLRKSLYFMEAGPIFGIPDDNGSFFRGSYDGSEYLFAGIATDEIYLIKAECLIRSGEKDKALEVLNYLLKYRWSNSVTYVPITAGTTQEALDIILRERRKELLMRGLRWTDIRRLNKGGGQIEISRILNGQEFTLPSNSLRFTYLIPNDVISLNPGMIQNPR